MAKALDMTSQPPFLRSALLCVFLYPMFTPCLRVRGKVERGHLASVPIKEGDAKGKEKGREGKREGHFKNVCVPAKYSLVLRAYCIVGGVGAVHSRECRYTIA